MSIQIITNFPTESKVCGVCDHKHMELYVEGNARHNFDIIATLAAKLCFDTAEHLKDDEEFLGAVEKRQGKGLTDKDQAIFACWDKLQEMITKELGKLKIQEMFEADEDLNKIIPKAMQDAFADMIFGKAVEEYHKKEEGEEDE